MKSWYSHHISFSSFVHIHFFLLNIPWTWGIWIFYMNKEKKGHNNIKLMSCAYSQRIKCQWSYKIINLYYGTPYAKQNIYCFGWRPPLSQAKMQCNIYVKLKKFREYYALRHYIRFVDQVIFLKYRTACTYERMWTARFDFSRLKKNR